MVYLPFFILLMHHNRLLKLIKKKLLGLLQKCEDKMSQNYILYHISSKKYIKNVKQVFKKQSWDNVQVLVTKINLIYSEKVIKYTTLVYISINWNIVMSTNIFLQLINKKKLEQLDIIIIKLFRDLIYSI